MMTDCPAGGAKAVIWGPYKGAKHLRPAATPALGNLVELQLARATACSQVYKPKPPGRPQLGLSAEGGRRAGARRAWPRSPGKRISVGSTHVRRSGPGVVRHSRSFTPNRWPRQRRQMRSRCSCSPFPTLTPGQRSTPPHPAYALIRSVVSEPCIASKGHALARRTTALLMTFQSGFSSES